MQRSNLQNRSIHKYCKQVADEAKNKGVTVKMMIDALPDADIPMNETIVKDIWKIFQEKILHKTSTTELTTAEVDQVYDPMSMFLSKNFDITLDFPSVEAKLRERDGY